uniref:Uncharacterized protein n=1 Tax=Anguilla anguilla TaxID=7936 RepID=A0A0E9SJV7_ANGAN
MFLISLTVCVWDENYLHAYRGFLPPVSFRMGVIAAFASLWFIERKCT